MYDIVNGRSEYAAEKKRFILKHRLILIAVGIALIALNILVFNIAFTVTQAGILSTDITELNLQKEGISDLSGIERCRNLRQLDLRQNPVSIEQYEFIKGELPECDIVWDIPVDTYRIDCTKSSLDLSGGKITGEGSRALRYMKGLTDLDLREIDLSDTDIAFLRESLPGCNIKWSVCIGGMFYDADSLSITLTDAPADQLDRLAWFEQLESVDANACAAYHKLSELAAGDRSYSLDWHVVLGGASYSPDITELTLANIPAEEIERLTCFSSLKNVNAKACTSYAELYAVSQKMTDCRFSWDIPLTDKIVVPSDKTYINLSDAVIDDFESFKTMLGYLPALTKVKMHNCSLTYDQLDELRSMYPEKGIYWLVKFWRWEVPTNAQVFSCLNKAVTYRRCTEEDLAPLKYCKDLRCVDLGHNGFSSLSFLSGLTKLQVLIVTDCDKLTDISVLAECKELEYIELLSTGVSDISPLGEIDSLVSILAYNSPVTDVTPLLNNKKLRYVTLGKLNCPEEQYNIVDSMPEFNRKDSNGWYGCKQYRAYKEVFKNWQDVKYYNSWTDYSIK